MKEKEGDLPRAHYHISYCDLKMQYKKSVQFLLNVTLKLTMRIWVKKHEPLEWWQLYAASAAADEGGAHLNEKACWMSCCCQDHLAGDSSRKEIPSSGDSSSWKPDMKETHYISEKTVHITETAHTSPFKDRISSK
jgi:hypothetical protein